MNSMSKDHYDSCEKEKREENHCKTIIKCGFTNSTTLPVITGSDKTKTFTISSLTLDTSCLCDPCIKLEFASNLVSTNFSGTVSFQIFKQCKKSFIQIPVGSEFIYTAVEGAPAKEDPKHLEDPEDSKHPEHPKHPKPPVKIFSSTFSFFVCDCDSCFDECCTYTVVARAINDIYGSLAINNATLGAIATCNSNKCKRKCN